jgi:hypothetical protein
VAESEGRRRSRGGTEGAAQQQLLALCSLGFTGPPGTASHAFIQSLRSCDSGRASGRHSPAAATAPSVAAGHLHTVTGAFAEPLQNSWPSVAAAWFSPRQDSRRRGPAAPLQCPASPGTGRCLQASHTLLFYNLRTGELVHPVRAKHCLPGDRHGPWNSFRSMPSNTASTGSERPVPRAVSRTLNGGGWRPSYSWPPMLPRPHCRQASSELTWLSGDL